MPASYFIPELRSSLFVKRGLPPPAAAVASHLVLLLNRPKIVQFFSTNSAIKCWLGFLISKCTLRETVHNQRVTKLWIFSVPPLGRACNDRRFQNPGISRIGLTLELLSRILKSLIKVGYSSRFKSFLSDF